MITGTDKSKYLAIFCEFDYLQYSHKWKNLRNHLW